MDLATNLWRKNSKLVVMFGGFQSLMHWKQFAAGLNIVTGLVFCEVTTPLLTTPGTADSFLKASHVSRTRHAHQVIASALDILVHEAFDCYCQSLSEGDDLLTFSQTEQWKTRRWKSTVPLLVIHPETSANHSDICEITVWRKLPSL